MENNLIKDSQWPILIEKYHLTPREVQIAKQILQGADNSEICRALSIRPGTVKAHLKNIYRKTGVCRKIILLLKFFEDVSSEM